MSFKRAYNEAERAIAVEIIRRYGKLSGEAISEIRSALDAPTLSKSTIHGWLPPGMLSSPETSERIKSQFEPVRTIVRTSPQKNTEKKNRIPSPEAQKKAAETLDDAFEEIARLYLDRASEPSVINDVKGKDAVMTAAIAVDKMRLLRNLPTEIIELLPPFQMLVERLIASGRNPAEFIYRTLSRLEETNDLIIH